MTNIWQEYDNNMTVIWQNQDYDWNVTGMWEINDKNMTWRCNMLTTIQQEYNRNMTRIWYQYDSKMTELCQWQESGYHWNIMGIWQEYEKCLLPFEYAGPIPNIYQK